MENFKNKILEHYKIEKELKEASESFVDNLLNTPDFHYLFCHVTESGYICDKTGHVYCKDEDGINKLKDHIKKFFKLKWDESGVIFYDDFSYSTMKNSTKLNFKESLDEQIRKAKSNLLIESNRIKNIKRQETVEEIYRLKSRLGYLENYLKTL